MTESRFWRICEPEYDSDYDRTFINGWLDHPYSLPGVECGTCKETWGGSRVLPIDCPMALRDVRELKDAWPISAELHRQLRERVRAEIISERGLCPELAPGDLFQPCFLDVPSTPDADFLWPAIGSPVISDRMRSFFEQLGSDVASVVSVKSRKIGAARPILPAPIPESGEPEDLLTEMKLYAMERRPYFELIVSAESGLPHGTKRLPPCPGCGRAELEGSREFTVYDDMVPAQPLFLLATTLWLVVTDALKRDLQRIKPTNARFTPVKWRTPIADRP
jgi:hypothetical protein